MAGLLVVNEHPVERTLRVLVVVALLLGLAPFRPEP